MEKSSVYLLEVIEDKIKELVKEMFPQNSTKVLISQLYGEGYLLTLIFNDKKTWYEDRQSYLFKDFNVDLRDIIQTLYNRTT
jgi:hypothetical protein